MKVLGTAGTAEGERVVKQAGASQVFNHRQDGFVQDILVLCCCHISIKHVVNFKIIFKLCS